ncbi:hypothetical protein Bca52824_023128 [Brassica carinata]|uniref:Uncharacterized protein n=1 Tax=Brassica carinata TaxID=52824 RepID=A0A8X7VI41_BRACI|nr:hypothetical protein Bca52824_023128 [Brassica carinata]
MVAEPGVSGAKKNKKRKRNESGVREVAEEEEVEEATTGEISGKRKSKKKKKKSVVEHRSSPGEREGSFGAGTARSSPPEERLEDPEGVHHGDDDAVDRPERSLERLPPRVPESPKEIVVRSPHETLPRKVSFEFARELPLAFCEEECANLVRQIKGGPKDLSPVKDLVLKEDYTLMRVHSQGDWNAFVLKYDKELKRDFVKIREKTEEGEHARREHHDSLQAMIRERDDTVT